MVSHVQVFFSLCPRGLCFGKLNKAVFWPSFTDYCSDASGHRIFESIMRKLKLISR